MTKKSSKKAANTRFPDDLDTLKSYAADVLALAKKMGASSCEVDIAEGFGLSANVRMGEIEAIEHNSDKGIGVTVYVGQKKGNASTSDFSAKARRETVEALTGAPYDLQSIGLNLISLGGNVEETEDEFILHWNR